MPGTYTLLIELAAPATIEFGASGTHDLDRGWYAYTGSAFGPSGFARVDRHRELSRGERDARHWHVDYLLGHRESRVAEVVRSHDMDVECAVSRGIDGEPISGLGASDCNCDSHLRYRGERDALLSAVRTAHERARESVQSDP